MCPEEFEILGWISAWSLSFQLSLRLFLSSIDHHPCGSVAPPFRCTRMENLPSIVIVANDAGEEISVSQYVQIQRSSLRQGLDDKRPALRPSTLLSVSESLDLNCANAICYWQRSSGIMAKRQTGRLTKSGKMIYRHTA